MWKKLGMWLYIISDSLTFSALLISYAYVRLETPDWPRPFEIWPAIAKSSLMTFVLLSSSLTMVLGVNAAFKGDRKKTVRYLIATICLRRRFRGDSCYGVGDAVWRRRDAVDESVASVCAALRRDVFRVDRAAHAARDDWRDLSGGDCVGIREGEVHCRACGGQRALLALCGFGVDVYFPDGVFAERESEVTTSGTGSECGR